MKSKTGPILAALGIAAIGVIFLIGVFFTGRPDATLSIVSGSENKGLEPIVTDWARANNIDVTMTYRGSVDISRELSRGKEGAFDAVWPAHSLWIELGDSDKVVKHRESILRSPIVLGLRKSIAQRLGWIGREDITIQDIAAAARDGEFRLSMTSATQSNSGASAYIGFLYALAGNPDILTQDNLNDPTVQDGVRDLLALVDRSSGSSGWLADSLVENPQAYDAMFNYEAMVLEANQELVRTGQEPLYIIYPSNGSSVADSPLGYVSKGDDAKEQAFLALQKHLLSSDTQNEITRMGRRAGLLGLSADATSAAIWNADWGVDLDRSIAPVPTPESDVIREALRLYQTELRKPSLTIWVLDVSGSMNGEPLDQLKEAMRLLLDPDEAAMNLLQPSGRDITIILPFSGKPYQPHVVVGADAGDLSAALSHVNALQAGGGTDLYAALTTALEELVPYNEKGELEDYLPAIVAMTDGASNTSNRGSMMRAMQRLPFGRDVPIHSIAFGDADEDQLKELSEATIGRLFKARGDLAKALRSAKGYN
ncbi:substrate-binding domain-containing protein [Halovulum sp. GXIMD14793]